MAEALVLHDVTLVDGTGGAPVPRSQVVVEDGVIVSVGGASSPPVAGASVVEGRGRWVLPGLWDTHVHHRFSAGGMFWPEEFGEEQRLLNWRAYLACGVTSVVSIGDDPATTVAARSAEQEGSLVGPRVVAAGSVFTAPGGHPMGTVLRNPAVRVGALAIEVGDPGEARRHLRRQCTQHGIDLVKVVYSSIPGGGPRLGRAVLDALIDESHLLGRRIFAHVSTSEEAAECVQAGVDGLEHMVLDDGPVLDRALADARERGVFWTPTLSLFDRMAHDHDPAYIDDYRPDGFVSDTVLRSARTWAAQPSTPPPGAAAPPWERTVELAGRAHRAGVRLSLGTDAGMVAVFHGLAVHRELELLVRAGLTPLQALAAATTTAAAKVGAEERLGSVRPGKEADLLLLRESPLDDIRNTRSIDMVIKRGTPFDPAELRVS